MSELLLKLGNDWHASNVYDKLILSVVPKTKHKERIQHYLYTIYVDSHYDYKPWRQAAQGTVYDMDIDLSKGMRKNLEEKYAKEEETFKKLCEKFESLGGTEGEGDAPEEHEEEDTNEEEDSVQEKSQKDTKILTKAGGKQALLQAKEKERLRLSQLKNTKANMATTQQNLMDIQKEIEMIDTKITYYGHYQYADRGLSISLRKIILEYAKTKDDETLIRQLDDIIDYYEMIRRRYVPKDPCQGLKGLCETHYLPLHATKWSVTKVSNENKVMEDKVIEAKCPLSH